jgi:hypothetical protein
MKENQNEKIKSILNLYNIDIDNIRNYSVFEEEWKNSFRIMLTFNSSNIYFIYVFLEGDMIRLSSVDKGVSLFSDKQLFYTFAKNNPEKNVIHNSDIFMEILLFITDNTKKKDVIKQTDAERLMTMLNSKIGDEI